MYIACKVINYAVFYKNKRKHRFLRGELRAPRSLQGCAGNFALRARCKLRGELRTSCSLQVARGTSHSAFHNVFLKITRETKGK